MQDMVVVGLIVEELSNINVKCVKYKCIGQGHRVKVPAKPGLVVVGLIFEEYINVKCVSHWSAKYRSRSTGQGT